MRNKNVVTIGGGTGSFVLLSGLKKYPLNISAIVSMADDGGSTGILRDELGVLPPGDVRQCLVALSDSSETLRALINYRFQQGGLKGHSFGNLFLSALEKIQGNFSKGVEEAAKILNVKGQVIPVTNQDMRLHIRLKNKKIISGEKELDHNEQVRETGIESVFLKPKVKASARAVERIKKADFIIIGPGDFYGSIVPNLLVEGISEAIGASKAKVIYNCNLTNKKGQTSGFNLDNYVDELNKLISKGRIDFVVFSAKNPPERLISKYKKREGEDVLVKFDSDKKRKFKIIRADLLDDSAVRRHEGDLIAHTRSFVRHDSDKLAKVITIIMELGSYENIIKGII